MYIFGKYSKKNRFARNFHFFYSLNKKISSSGDFIPYFSRAYFSRASKLLSSKNNIQIKNSNTTDIIPYLLNMKYLA